MCLDYLGCGWGEDGDGNGDEDNGDSVGNGVG